MIPVRENGSIDVKFIEILPLDDFEEIINEMNREQINYFDSFATKVAGPTKPVKTGRTLEDLEDWGFGIVADKILARLRERIRRFRK